MSVSAALTRACHSLLLLGFEGHEGPPELLSRLRRGAAGVILFSRNLGDMRQIASLVGALARTAARPPVLVAVDQEGGRVQRLRAPLPVWPPMRRLGELDRPELTKDVGRALGSDLRALGFNLDFAPVLDVVQSDENTVIGDRSFGADPERVARHGLALAEGLLESGVLPCGKHFPGHGGPVADSHQELPEERRGADELRRVDLLPFRRFAEAGMPLLMSAHVHFRHLDPALPGTLSPLILTRLLREELGFKGVLCSDDMEMGAIAGHQGAGEAAVLAVAAGVDLLLFCRRESLQEEALEVLVHEAERSPALRRRVEQSAARLDSLRRRLPAPSAASPEDLERLLSPDRHAELLAELQEEPE